jgi:hypothetical protein
LSQGGVTATLLSYNKNAPGSEIMPGVVSNETVYNVTLTLNLPLQYFGPSSKSMDGFVWSDNSSGLGNTTLSSQADNTSVTTTFFASSPTGTTAYPVEYRMMLPTESGDATYVFIWSLT